MNSLQNLLNQVETITRKNNEILDASGSRFNLFRIFGVDHYENTHSAIIAELLNPEGTHGLKHKFLECFLETVNVHNLLPHFDCENCKVKTEADTNNGRIDILITDNNRNAIIIENKIYANDQWEQLRRYNDYAQKEYGDNKYVIYYLTLYGNEASEQSAKGVTYSPISYSTEVIDWLNKCIDAASRFPLVRESLIQYVNHLKRLTNQDMDAKNKEEIVKLIVSGNNLDAAFTIAQNLSSVKEHIVYEFFNKSIEEIAKEFNFIPILIKSKSIYAGFGFEVPNWNYFKISFEFDGNEFTRLGYMFSLKKPNDNYNKEIIEKLHPLFKNHNKNTNIPIGWNYLNKYRDWDLDAYKAIMNGEMKDEIRNIVKYLLEISKDAEM